MPSWEVVAATGWGLLIGFAIGAAWYSYVMDKEEEEDDG